jgi:hypothetical protein
LPSGPCGEDHITPPNPTARFWWRFALSFADEFGFWVERGGRVVDCHDFDDGL